jgi:NAD(P)-dependent dehydrogenase (short-subunit alcohol dehydrogenase family)
VARRWLVTGCSSGLGRAIAAAVARAGDEAVVTARQVGSLADLVAEFPSNLYPVAMDLRDAQQCEDAVKSAVERFGGIDVLVNNAGGGLFGAVEEVSDDELRAQLETLVVGPWRLARLVLPAMRAQGSGHIVNISTTGTRAPVPGLAAYLSSKRALEGMSQALAAEVAGFGIRVTIAEPGAYATNYGSALAEASSRLPEYTELAGVIGMFRGMADNPELGRPDDFADTLLRIVGTETPMPLRVPVGPFAYEMLGEALTAAQDDFERARVLTAPEGASSEG